MGEIYSETFAKPAADAAQNHLTFAQVYQDFSPTKPEAIVPVAAAAKPAEPPSPKRPELSADRVLEVFERIRPLLDTNGDGYVSAAEVNAAFANPALKGEEAQMVALLREKGDKLQKLSNDEWGRETSGVTVADMKEFDKQNRAYDNDVYHARLIEKYGQLVFDAFDKNHDGYLDKSELQTLAKEADSLCLPDKDWAADKADFARAISTRRQEIADVSNDEWGWETSISKADLKGYYAATVAKHDQALLQSVRTELADSAERLKEYKVGLYGYDNNAEKAIVPEAVVQGGIGDCYFMAALSSLARSKPGRESIQKMIKDNGVDAAGHHTYTVTFPGAADEPITIMEPTEAERSKYAKVNEHGLWPAILEKAYGSYYNGHKWSPYEVPQDALDGGSVTSAGLRILTANGVNHDTVCLTSYATMKKRLTEAMDDGRPVTAAIAPEIGHYLFGLADNKTDDKNLQCGHEYAVIGYDPKTELITIRNPWGSGEPTDEKGNALDGTDDGIFTMTLPDFCKNFSFLNYANSL